MYGRCRFTKRRTSKSDCVTRLRYTTALHDSPAFLCPVRIRSFYVLVLLAFVASLCPAGAQDLAELKAGPMLGPLTHRTATVWVQTARPAEVALRYAVVAVPGEGQPRARPITTAPASTGPANDHVALFTLTGLEPGWTYSYTVLVDGEEVVPAYPTQFTTQPLWQWRTDPPAFTAAFGSCAYVNDSRYDRPGKPAPAKAGGYGGDYQVFDAIAALSPDLMLWLGDNTYLRDVDWWSPWGIGYRYGHTRALPELQRLLAATPHYATWDDHDYGPNNADRSYVLKDAALDAFKRYWPNPTYGLPGVPGVFTHFQFADVEFFVLDNRYYRTPNDAPDDPGDTVLGPVQRQWLLDALTSSQALFKVVAMGGQLLNPLSVFETYANVAPEERALLLAEIERREIEGLVLLSGDRHHSELIRLERSGTYPLYEFTSSPLTAGAVETPRDAENPARVPGTLVAGKRGFGTLTVEGPRTERVMTLRAYDAFGDVLWSHTITAAELRGD